tara:strand:- start:281 stop:454 length:174 start_codon:yes stop_codon:yes gene_type:complete
VLAVASEDIVQAKASLIERQVQQLQAERKERISARTEARKDATKRRKNKKKKKKKKS